MFSHLGSALFAHMQEDIFSDRKESDCEDEKENNSDSDESESETGSINVNGDSEDSNKEVVKEIDDIVECILDSAVTIIESKAPKTVTSMYGKVYVLKT